MRNLLTATGLTALLTACATAPPDYQTIIQAEEGKTDMLDFRDVASYPGYVNCGSYQVTSKWGESYGYKDFIVIGSRFDRRPTPADKTIYCSDDPQQAFEEQFGIVPADKTNAALAQFRKDYKTLQEALESYRADMPKYPTAAEGLPYLLAETHETPPKDFQQGGYLDAIPVDYWQREYIYEPSRWAGVKQAYTIKTLGADGKVGGTGEDADISSAYLEYLEHLDSL